MDLLKLIPKISKTIKSNTLKYIYAELKSHPHLSQVVVKIEPINVIKIVFGVFFLKKGDSNIKELLNQIDVNLYGFSIIRIDRQSEIPCEECNGQGSVTCDNCNANGRTICPECDGSGQIENGDDNEDEEECDSCNGRGSVTCDVCDGESVLECHTCDSDGTIVSDDYTDFTIDEFVGIDRTILDRIEIANSANVPISDDFELEIQRNCINLGSKFSIFNEDRSEMHKIEEEYKGNTYVNHLAEVMDLTLRWSSWKGNMIRIGSSDADFEEVSEKFFN